MPNITAAGKTWSVPHGTNLHTALCQADFWVDAPCGGNGTCGKCSVTANGVAVRSCRFSVTENLTVELPQQALLRCAADAAQLPAGEAGFALAFDIGTTSVAGFLINGKGGTVLAKDAVLNPQTTFGADVISRIQAALCGQMEALTASIRLALGDMILRLCAAAAIHPEQINRISIVGNGCMQQLFLGIAPNNLAQIPFESVITQAKVLDAAPYLPLCHNAKLLIVPNISGFVGADTVGCILSDQLHLQEELTLLVDIGTNGEMVLGNSHRMVACSTAAGPALEGANIHFGMRAVPGAIDHVWLEEDTIRYSVIGGIEASGICGSGLIDAIAAGLQLGKINQRGRIETQDRKIHITDRIYLTQEDIRQVQLAKGAIHAGICLMARHLEISLAQIRRVRLAGAFGSHLRAQNTCRIGLLPEELADRVTSIGNAAGMGAQMIACDPKILPLSQKIVEATEFLELSTLQAFPKTFAKSMLFREENR